MIETSDLKFFLALSRENSLSAAARALGVTPPAVSQRLALLEERIGLKLIERGNRRLRPTSDGELLARRAEDILAELDELTEDLAIRQGRISGELKVIAPFGFGRLHIAPLMASFATRNPDCNLNLVLSDDPYGVLHKASWDILIHVGRLPDLDLVQRRLAPNRRILCASPDYVRSSPTLEAPEDLKQHRCGVIREDDTDVTLWSFTHSAGHKKSVRIRPHFSSNDGEVVRSWALSGLGVVERSQWSIASDLESGRLVEVLKDWRLGNADVVALLNPRLLRAARVQAFLDDLARAFSKPPWASGE